MFGPAGHLYVYFTYGMHFCMNVVTGADGEGSAVLLRAAEPVAGLETMSRLRRMEKPRLLCSGPARLTQALSVTRVLNGTDLVAGDELFVAAGEPVGADDVSIGPRVGIRRAAEKPWRFRLAGSPFVSPGRPASIRPHGRR